MNRAMVWFRRDLRIRDNPALHDAAGASPRGVVGVYVISPEEWRRHDEAPAKVDFWLRNLRELHSSLGALNIPLVLVRAERARDVPGVLLRVALGSRCDALYFNREYEVDERARDELVCRTFAERGIRCGARHDRVIFDPETIRTQDGRFYSTFTPFHRRVRARIEEEGIRLLPAPAVQPAIEVKSGVVPGDIDGFCGRIDPGLWPAGEAAAHARLERFVERRVEAYPELRDIPSVSGTSALSPYLSAGVVSVRQCMVAALDRSRSADTWAAELLWREFYQHILINFPRVSMGRAFKSWTERIRWREDPEAFERWRSGQTGVPIVDAGMRQLLAMGWMHNRLRMITAMYLTKDLFLDWRLGERHFMRSLVDGELASNNGGWQWCASTGCDAAPYFRIFNPARQSERFDPEGAFIRRWVPELADVEPRALHDPERLDPLRKALDYPALLVAREGVRERVMKAFVRAGGAGGGGAR